MTSIWKGWRPTTKKYDPNDPHFNPMHPPIDTPKEVLERIWGESSDPNELVPPIERTETGKAILPWLNKESDNSNSL